MYCLFCGNSLPEGASFCLKCGTLTPKRDGKSGNAEQNPALTIVSAPSAFSSSRPSTSYGPGGDMQKPYTPPNPYMPPVPPPPRRRRFSSGFLKGFFSAILVLLLLGGGLGGLLLFKRGALSSLIQHAVKPTATPVHSASPTANPIAQFLPGTWTQCAVENATCTFSGTMTVAFGANGSYTYATKSGGTDCTQAIFGDPLSGVQKACYKEAAPPTTNVWAQCASENANCAFVGTMTVAFGANGMYKYATKTNGAACNTGIFGDPFYGTAKSCYLLSPPSSAAIWTTCATENSTCTFTDRHEVAYGGSGGYFYGSFTNGTECTNSVFGDPDSGVAKTCYYQK